LWRRVPPLLTPAPGNSAFYRPSRMPAPKPWIEIFSLAILSLPAVDATSQGR
jgi:hypothetical protein